MSQPNKPAPADRLKTVFIIGVSVPGDKSAEPMAIYYGGIVQPYEMTFNRTGTVRRCGPGQMEPNDSLPVHKPKLFVKHSKELIDLRSSSMYYIDRL